MSSPSPRKTGFLGAVVLQSIEEEAEIESAREEMAHKDWWELQEDPGFEPLPRRQRGDDQGCGLPRSLEGIMCSALARGMPDVAAEVPSKFRRPVKAFGIAEPSRESSAMSKGFMGRSTTGWK